MIRRSALLTLAACGFTGVGAQPLVPGSPVDGVALYVIPTDGFPEEVAANVARALTKDTGIWVKSTMKMPSDSIEPFAGTNQYPADDYLPMGIRVSKQLQDTTVRTYFIVLTDRDINSRSQNFRFLYSFHNPMARTSVLSVARLFYEKDGSRSTEDVMLQRIQKMLMRIVGEMRFGWKRTNEPTDLMFVPIMSIEDIDRMSLIHSIERRKP
jgi:predicted Zn-dependent protease